jgi:hypothetical protein
MRRSPLYLKLNTPGDIDRVIKYLENYKQTIISKTQEFVDKLIDVGIEVAQHNTGEYAGYIVFSKQIKPTEDGCVGYLVATDGKKIIRQWKYKGGIKTAEVSPLLMAEFGSGWLAHVMSTQDYRSNDLNVGQGTFPNQTHAFDKEGWFWETPDGEKHHSYGEKPSYPLYSATLAMIYEVERIAKEVFSNG